ncbi:MAG: SIMPL domain-containing protein [Candidatus Pacebacteria bacterium]|nr:SIMPL domain-containing protein [Candidatus Paceibacterota bacterium]
MDKDKTRFFKALTVLAVVGAVLLFAMTITEIKGYRFIGGGVSASNTISVSGDGEVYAAPDIATVSFTVTEESKKVADAQDKVTTKVKTALTAIRSLGVADKDIKTENYSSYPKYEYRQGGTVVCMSLDCPSPVSKQVLVGYEVSQYVSITVRDLDSVNSVVDALGTAGVTNMQGPDFAIDKQDAFKADARKQAIDKAKEKAKVLARDLGVSLVRIVSFSEGGDYPVYYDRAMMSSGKGVSAPQALPELPQGQEKITSQVTITYEIR